MSTGATIGAAANIAGGEIQGWAALFEQWAMKNAYDKQATAQRAFADQAGGVLDQRLSTAGAGPAGQQMGQAQQAREGMYRSVNATPLSMQSSPLGQQQNARNSAYTSLLGGQRAKLGSYGDWLQNQWMANQQTGRDLGQVENFAKGSASVFPINIYSAQHSMDNLAAIGQAISSIGGGAANYASLFNSTPGGQQSQYSLGGNPATNPGNYNSMYGSQLSNDPAGEVNI